MDIIRNGDGTYSYSTSQMQERVWKDAYYYLPIPQDEIFKNPNLTQNPGYGQ